MARLFSRARCCGVPFPVRPVAPPPPVAAAEFSSLSGFAASPARDLADLRARGVSPLRERGAAALPSPARAVLSLATDPREGP